MNASPARIFARRRIGATLVLSLLLHGCFDARSRPSPVEVFVPARLSVQVLAPRAGLAVPTGSEIIVRVSARDLDITGLSGVGYVARQFLPLRPRLDSAAVRFSARTDTIHEFLLRIPESVTSNTQIDIYGIAFGPGAQSAISPPSYVIAVRCVNGVCR